MRPIRASQSLLSRRKAIRSRRPQRPATRQRLLAVKLARRRPHPARRQLLRAMRLPLRAVILQAVQPRLRAVRLVPAMRQQARAMPPSALAASPFPKSRSIRRVVPAPERRLALAQPSTPLTMSTQVAPLVVRRLEPGLARRARRCRAMRFTRRRRRSCGRRLLCLHRTRQYHRRRLHRTRPHHRLHRRTWPPHRSASLPLRRRHGPPRRRDPRRLRPKSARRINQSAEPALPMAFGSKADRRGARGTQRNAIWSSI